MIILGFLFTMVWILLTDIFMEKLLKSAKYRDYAFPLCLGFAALPVVIIFQVLDYRGLL